MTSELPLFYVSSIKARKTAPARGKVGRAVALLQELHFDVYKAPRGGYLVKVYSAPRGGYLVVQLDRCWHCPDARVLWAFTQGVVAAQQNGRSGIPSNSLVVCHEL